MTGIPSLAAPARIADRLAAARRRTFVGREREIALFASALASAQPGFAVLHLHGPGGIGKTALLREFARLAEEAARPTACIDGRNVEPSPTGMLAAVAGALALPGDALAQAARRCPPDIVLLIDTYEVLAPLDAWLRESFLPQLPARAVVVIAGRDEPSHAWRTEAGWSSLTHVVALRNLDGAESEAYLAACGVPGARHAETLAFTHGHPLALSLVVDVLKRSGAHAPLDAQRQPDVVRVLLERFVQDVPSLEHRLALQACATAWATTEGLLAAALGRPDVHDLFEWLGRLSFIEQGPYGLFPHDLARDVLYADFRWRDPDACRALIERILAHEYRKLHHVTGVEQQRVWFGLLYVQRHNPLVSPFVQWSSWGTYYTEPAKPGEHEAILSMVARHEGAASAAIARHWLQRQPEAFLACRSVSGELLGFVAHLRIDAATAQDLAIDPAVRAALAFAERHGPARPDEEVTHARFWMAADGYQAVSPVAMQSMIASSLHWTGHARMAWSFLSLADPAVYDPLMTDIHLWPSPEAAFEVGGRRYTVYTHDWRAETASMWVAMKAERAMRAGADTRPPAPPARLVLSQEAFTRAVRDALREYTRPHRLAANPLLRTGLLAAGTAETDAVEALRALLREAAQTLAPNPKDRKLYLALLHTYLEPAPTQERAAELLDLPFNTYRYQLARGTERITAWLWQRELRGPR